MSWNDFYRRRDALDAVLRRAELDPAAPPVHDPSLFPSRDDLLLALHHRWMQQLTGRLGVALSAAEDGNGDADRVEVVVRTWCGLAAEQPVLRAVLDHHLADRAAVEREQRLLALTAGLAELSEPDEEITPVGAAFLNLVRATPPRARRRPLLHRLARSA
ncbi:hypothetical protein [Umezawaea beigongshangensis]|uniref:hypothetical protein n=1 Tax=Umezawaea beigongshangensis TaxID=2780383 RepID=UPI0018F266EB|nr:hypothetical protein [Umezawaea beigongshangensis]